ncbi:hypothetical protein SKAU_G00184240 [Synaphobranchus kaupii]|uniref:Optineurin n=1 Tax=Synaphobranchus kaupii TaxID=118154 RepID=A0A9Q1IWS9_SYNKA|nr:hypothetical protein SKAU_G00184240 [Synaphobranchus kaupii]
MASNGPTVNGDGSVDSQSATDPRVTVLEETLQQMKILINENRELKALQRNKSSTEETFEGLETWKEKEKQKVDRELLRLKLEEATRHIHSLTKQNEKLSKGGTQISKEDLSEIQTRLETAERALVTKQQKIDEMKPEIFKKEEELKQTCFISVLDRGRVQISKEDLSELQTRLETAERALVTKQQKIDEMKPEIFRKEEELEVLSKELQKVRSDLESAESDKKTLNDRCGVLEQDRADLQEQLEERQQQQVENEQLMQSVRDVDQRSAEELKKNLAQLQESYTKLSEENARMKEEVKKTEEDMSTLETRFETAEKALVTKQQKIDEMKQEFFKNEKELETISVFKAQAELYSADFYAERTAREKIHEEKERLIEQLEVLKQRNDQLQEELDSQARRSLTEVQRRHLSPGARPEGGAAARAPLGAKGVKIKEHTCPKCNMALPDLDSLQIHIMDCID